MFITKLDSPIGPLWLESDGNDITGLYFEKRKGESGDNLSLHRQAAEQLAEYFGGERKNFTLPLRLEGTAFRRRVWLALSEIPYGTTITYGELAKAVGNPKASRAVGQANHNNPISIILPCHRVIGVGGNLTGYGGGLEKKRFLLNLEGALLEKSGKSRKDRELRILEEELR